MLFLQVRYVLYLLLDCLGRLHVIECAGAHSLGIYSECSHPIDRSSTCLSTHLFICYVDCPSHITPLTDRSTEISQSGWLVGQRGGCMPSTFWAGYAPLPAATVHGSCPSFYAVTRPRCCARVVMVSVLPLDFLAVCLIKPAPVSMPTTFLSKKPVHPPIFGPPFHVLQPTIPTTAYSTNRNYNTASYTVERKYYCTLFSMAQ